MNHLFKVALNWIKKESKMDSSTRIYTKSHHISIEGKPDLEVSAAKAFKGDPNLYNPEDLLLSSLTSCHMMSYLYCCMQHKIICKDNNEIAVTCFGVSDIDRNDGNRIMKFFIPIDKNMIKIGMDGKEKYAKDKLTGLYSRGGGEELIKEYCWRRISLKKLVFLYCRCNKKQGCSFW